MILFILLISHCPDGAKQLQNKSKPTNLITVTIMTAANGVVTTFTLIS